MTENKYVINQRQDLDSQVIQFVIYMIQSQAVHHKLIINGRSADHYIYFLFHEVKLTT